MPPAIEPINLSAEVTLVVLALKGAPDAGFLLLSQEGELRREGVAQVETWAEAVRAALDSDLFIFNIRKGVVSRPVRSSGLRSFALTPQMAPVDARLHGPTYKPVAWAFDTILIPDNPTWG